MSRRDEINKSWGEKRYLTEEENYELFILEYGPPLRGIRPDGAYANSYRDKVPDYLIRLWLEYGWGGWKRGGFWICDPALLQPLLDTVFDGDPDYNPKEMTPFAYNAFGKLYMWLGNTPVQGNYRTLEIDWLDNSACEYSHYSDWNKYAHVPVSASQNIMNMLEFEIIDIGEREDFALWWDRDDKDMLPQAIDRLGELSYGEVYGFVPALGLGGPNLVTSLQRLPILEYLTFLWQIQHPMLELYTLPKENETGYGTITEIRPIGRPE